MKIFKKLSLFIFSICIFAIAVFVFLVTVQVIDQDELVAIAEGLNEHAAISVILCIAVCIWAGVCIFKRSTRPNADNGILLENEHGTLLITKDSITNLIESVVNKNKDIKADGVKIAFNEENDLIVNVTVEVKDSTIIKEISAKLQEDIKLVIKKSTDLDVREVNIKVKDVEADNKEVKSAQPAKNSKN